MKKSLIAIAITTIFSGCASFGCDSTAESRAGAYCQKEAQGLSVHSKDYTIKAIAPLPAGIHLIDGTEWHCSGKSLLAEGTPILVRTVTSLGYNKAGKPILGDANIINNTIRAVGWQTEQQLNRTLRHEPIHWTCTHAEEL